MPDGKTTGKEETNLSVTGQTMSLSEQFHTPAVSSPEEDGVFRVGHFGNYIENTYSNYANSVDTNLSPQERRDAIANIHSLKENMAWVDEPSLRSDLRRYNVQTFASLDEYNTATDDALAFYQYGEGITMNRLSDEAREQLRNELREQSTEQLTMANRLAIRDATAENFTYFHELNHKHDYEDCQMNLLARTPVNAVRAQRLTETKSYAVEYLAAAQQYVYMKEQGINSIMVNGKEMPLDILLDQYPGLKEVVSEHGFDAKDPKSVRRVVAASAESWKNNLTEGYNSYMQHDFGVGMSYLYSQPLSKQLELLQNQDAQYEAISGKMLGKVCIGNNVTVDLSGCRDLLDTVKEEDISQLQDSDYIISYEELKSVNDYLEKKGITSDCDKMRYLSGHLKNLAYRLGEDKDPELTKLLLAQNNSVICVDGLAYSLKEDGEVVLEGGKPTKVEKPAQAVEDNKKTETKGQDIAMLMAQQTR